MLPLSCHPEHHLHLGQRHHGTSAGGWWCLLCAASVPGLFQHSCTASYILIFPPCILCISLNSMGLQLSLPTGHLQSSSRNTLDSEIRGARTLEGANFDPVRIVTVSPVTGNRSEDIRFRDSGSNTLVPNADPLDMLYTMYTERHAVGCNHFELRFPHVAL